MCVYIAHIVQNVHIVRMWKILEGKILVNRVPWQIIVPRVHNFRGRGEYPTLYTAAKHTALSYDAIR